MEKGKGSLRGKGSFSQFLTNIYTPRWDWMKAGGDKEAVFREISALAIYLQSDQEFVQVIFNILTYKD